MINFSEPSTKRGAVWIAVAVIGMVLIATGRSVDQLLLLGAAVAGGLGLINDKPT